MGDILLFILLEKDNKKVLLPINEYYLSPKSKQAYPELNKLKLNKTFLINTCKKIYNEFYISSEIIRNGKSIGFIYEDKTFFHDPETPTADSKIYIPYDISKIFKAIFEEEKPSVKFEYDRISNIYKEKHDIFDQIINSRNQFIRKKLEKLIDEKNIYGIEQLVMENDYMKIKKMIIDNKSLKEILDNTFEFDIKKLSSKKVFKDSLAGANG